MQLGGTTHFLRLIEDYQACGGFPWGTQPCPIRWTVASRCVKANCQ
jgi:hypothetical protein